MCVQVDTFGEGFKYFVYTCRRGGGGGDGSAREEQQQLDGRVADTVLRHLGYDPEVGRQARGAGCSSHKHDPSGPSWL